MPSPHITKSPLVGDGYSTPGTASPRRLSGASTIPDASIMLKPPPPASSSRGHAPSIHFLSGSTPLPTQLSSTETSSVSTQTDMEPEDALSGYVPRSSFMRLQKTLREERATYTRELLALQQALTRVEHAQKAGSNVGSSSTARGASSLATARTAASDALARAVAHVELLSKTVTTFDLANEMAQEKEAAIAALRYEMDQDARAAVAAVEHREAELKVEISRLQRDVAALKNVHAVKIGRIKRQAEEAAANFTQETLAESASLKTQLAELNLQLNATKVELASSQAQNAQYTLQLSRLQQQLSEGIHERAAMKLALEEAAGAFETFAAQQQDFLKYQARVIAAQADKGYRRESVLPVGIRRTSMAPFEMSDMQTLPNAFTPRAPPTGNNLGGSTIMVKSPSAISPRAVAVRRSVQAGVAAPAVSAAPPVGSQVAEGAAAASFLESSVDDGPSSLNNTARAPMLTVQQPSFNLRPAQPTVRSALVPRDDLLTAPAPPM